jgi:hypothetical protein
MKTGNYQPIQITSVIVEGITDPPPGRSHYEIPLRLSRTPEPEWVQHFLRAWDKHQNHNSTHRAGMEVGADRIILDTTTIDDLEEFHVRTLKLALDEANQLASEDYGKLRSTVSAEQIKQKQHREHVAAVAQRLRFD